MKAIVQTQYGSPDVMQLQQVAMPTPKANEIRVRVHAIPVGFGDLLVRNFASVSPREFSMPYPLWIITRFVFGISKPKTQILGSEFAGEVEAVGADVTRFKVGDAVFGFRSTSFGANAEYLCVPEKSLVAHKPANMSYTEAATVPYGGITALSLLRKVSLQPGQKVLILGASGGIGAAAVQIAKHFGAEVTGVCSTPRMDYVKALGADHVIDYTQQDFTQLGKTYDLVFDILGRGNWAQIKRVLNPNGRYLLASFKGRQLLQMLTTSFSGDKKVICAMSDDSLDDLLTVKELVEAGHFKTMIDRTYPLEQAADAHRYAENGRKAGKIVITVNG